MSIITPSMKLNLEPFWTQWDHTLPHLTLWTKEGMWCDWCVWLHSAEIQKRHQDCNRHLQEQKSEEIWLDTTVMWCIKKKPLKGFNNLQETLWERSAASGQLFVFACCFLHNPCRTAGWERSGKVQWRMQSWAAGTDFCAPERQNTNVELIDASWKMPQRRHTRTPWRSIEGLTSQSWYNWRRDWYSLERSIRKSMSRSMQSGSESGSRLRIRKKHGWQIII